MLKRLATAAAGVPIVLAAVFVLPTQLFLLLVLLLWTWGVRELVRLCRCWAPGAPLGWLFALVPAAALLLVPESWGAEVSWGAEHVILGGVLLVVGAASAVLLAAPPAEERLPALASLGFGVPYLALPAASLVWLQHADPWILFLLLAVVWLGDSAAYLVGTRWGRRKLAPHVSPNKSWEGAVAGLVAAVGGAAVWSALYLGRLDIAVLAVAAISSAAAQVGDLVESMLKRTAGVKDSGSLLPGHGGFLDRMDALLFAAPVLHLGLWASGHVPAGW